MPSDSRHKQVASDVVAIKEGGDLDLSCPVVVQNEDMIISWTCDNEPANIRSSRIHVTDSGKLRIHSAKVGDSCNYRCEAADGFETFSVIIKVIIVDRRLMDQLARRTGVAGGYAPSSPGEDSKSLDQSSTVKSSNSKNDQHHSLIQLDRQSKSQSDGGLDIEMQIEPSEVHVSKNRTFSLECRIKHAPNLAAPQIIWLKEYIGSHVDSLDEALDKNLIVLDGVYYHSLNWPRALSYSKQSSTASSALLIKQPTFVHSGRYACFAGYPASIMNLHFNNSLSNASARPDDQQNDQRHSRSPTRYKIAQALVKVDDPKGEANFKAYLTKSSSPEDPRHNILVGVIVNNTWIRNLTIVLLLICVTLGAYIYFTARSGKAKRGFNRKKDVGSKDSPEPDSSRDLADTSQLTAPVSRESDYVPELPLDRFNLSHVPANSLINDSNPLGERYKFDQALLNERLNCIGTSNSFGNNDHIYSEIGYKNTRNSSEEPYYKQPIRSNKQ